MNKELQFQIQTQELINDCEDYDYQIFITIQQAKRKGDFETALRLSEDRFLNIVRILRQTKKLYQNHLKLIQRCKK